MRQLRLKLWKGRTPPILSERRRAKLINSDTGLDTYYKVRDQRRFFQAWEDELTKRIRILIGDDLRGYVVTGELNYAIEQVLWHVYTVLNIREFLSLLREAGRVKKVVKGITATVELSFPDDASDAAYGEAYDGLAEDFREVFERRGFSGRITLALDAGELTDFRNQKRSIAFPENVLGVEQVFHHLVVEKLESA